MEDRETARMRKYGESKTTRIMMATVPHVTSDSGLRKFQADGFLLTRVYVLEFCVVSAFGSTFVCKLHDLYLSVGVSVVDCLILTALCRN